MQPLTFLDKYIKVPLSKPVTPRGPTPSYLIALHTRGGIRGGLGLLAVAQALGRGGRSWLGWWWGGTMFGLAW